jgi:hypothetical protein
MDKTDKYIDDLFHQKFSGGGVTAPPSVSEWSQLSNVIRKKNFMRFSPGSFNVYYLTAVIGTLTTVGSFVLPDIIGNNKNEKEIPNTNIQITDTPVIKDTPFENSDSTFILKLEPQKANCGNTKTNLQLMINEPAVADSIQKIEVETKRVNQTEQIDSLGKEAEAADTGGGDKPVDKQLIDNVAPADTIVIIDTLRIQKKGIQFKRKKDAF